MKRPVAKSALAEKRPLGQRRKHALGGVCLNSLESRFLLLGRSAELAARGHLNERGAPFSAASINSMLVDGAASQARNPAATTTCASFWRKAVGSLVRQFSRQLGVDGR
jgi:hypothetical protein